MKSITKKSAQTTTSAKPTTLNLQTRPFTPTQTDGTLTNETAGDYRTEERTSSSENILERLISTPTAEPSTNTIRKKHFESFRSQAMPIQAKLNIGEPNDKYEQEADATAAKVVQQINASPQSQSVQRQDSVEEKELQMKPISTLQRDVMEEKKELQAKSLVQRQENLGGGEASTDLESSIQSARGSGQSLDAGLQAKMGQAMGADFSSVKVHTDSQSDQLNKSIQARAFTTGQDLFFRQGAYNPNSRDGQELIAHELTHVVQQKPDSKVIQRDVGFEFECGAWKMEKLNANLSDQQKVGATSVPEDQVDDVDKSAVIHQGNGFKMEADIGDRGSHIEFVLDPPFKENSSGKKALSSTMKSLKKFGDKLLAMQSNASIHVDNVVGSSFLSKDIGATDPNILIHPSTTLQAEPQLTAGIRLEQLASVLEKLTTERQITDVDDEEYAERRRGAFYLGGKKPVEMNIMAEAPSLVTSRYASFPNKMPHTPDTPSKQLTSLLAMMVGYLKMAKRKQAYAKTVAPVMARTDFAAMYKQIPEATYFKSYSDQWLSLVLHIAGMIGENDMPFFEGGVTYLSLGDQQKVQDGLSKGQWINGICKGTDYLTVRNFPDQDVSNNLFGLGEMGSKMDKVGSKSKKNETLAPIFEFRRLPSNMHHYAWPDFANELLGYFTDINQMKEASYTGEKVDSRIRKGK